MKPRSESSRKFKNNTKENNYTVTHEITPTNSASTTSGGTFAATISSCWNNSNNEVSTSPVRKPSTSKTASSSTQRQLPLCQLCAKTLGSHQEFICYVEPQDLLMNFYKHMEINSDDLPSLSNCTRTNFPFCKYCQARMVWFWEKQKILDDTNRDIRNLKIQIGEEVDKQEKSGKKFNRLGKSSKSHGVLQSSQLKRLILKGRPEKYLKPSWQEGTSTMTSAEPPAVEVNVESFENTESEDSENSIDVGMVSQDNINSSISIPNGNAEMGVNQRIQVKQEIHADNIDEDDEDNREEGDVFSLTERKRRFLHEGVEVYKATDALSKKEYLLCSLCSFIVPIKKYNTGKAQSPYMKMKIHIHNVHRQQSGVPVPPLPRERRCIPCNKKFSTLAELREHRAQHHPTTSFECDICKKPYKNGSNQHNLLQHKFSHKNDEERKAALEAREGGSYNHMLSRKLKTSSLVGKANRGRKKKEHTPKKKSSRVSSAASKIDKRSKQFECKVCNRMLGRCDLLRHMNTHSQDSLTSTSTDTRSGPRTRRAAEAERVGSILPQSYSNLANTRAVAGTSGSGLNVAVERSRPIAIGNGPVVTIPQAQLDWLMSN